MHPVDSSVAAHPMFVIETGPPRDTVRPSPLLPCYSPSIYSTPSWRDSAITLFEEDVQPVGLGIWGDVQEQAHRSRASVHAARASKILRVDSNKSIAGLLDTATVV